MSLGKVIASPKKRVLAETALPTGCHRAVGFSFCEPQEDFISIDLNKSSGLGQSQQFSWSEADRTGCNHGMLGDSFSLEGHNLDPSLHCASPSLLHWWVPK